MRILIADDKVVTAACFCYAYPGAAMPQWPVARTEADAALMITPSLTC
jgi:hypothetical protein